MTPGGLRSEAAPPWGGSECRRALADAEARGVELLVIGGGITGAGILRDAALRGLRALLVERDDFAAGTSSRSSKLVHGGLRYLAEGHLGLIREACRERDLLLRLDPHLVWPVPFLLPFLRGAGLPAWKARTALVAYAAASGFRVRPRFLTPERARALCPELPADDLRGAGLYTDGQTDDARLVLEVLKSARAAGGEAVNHAEVVALLRGTGGRIAGAVVRDGRSGRSHAIRAEVVVAAAGASLERVRALDRLDLRSELAPARGIHLVVPARRIRTRVAVSLPAADGRYVFVAPWRGVLLVGTTDTRCASPDSVEVTIDEVHYLLDAVNRALPLASLTTNDLIAVFAGVRPLVAGGPGEDLPSSRLSREDRIYRDPSGLIAVAGGKLTTFRAMAERVVDAAVEGLAPERRSALRPCATERVPIRRDGFELGPAARELAGRFGLPAPVAERLLRAHGQAAFALLESAPAALRRPVGSSDSVFAEIPWALAREAARGLCDVLERRLRVAVVAPGQGLAELGEIARVAAEAAGWDEARTREEVGAYLASLRRSYQIVVPREGATAAA